MTRTLSLALVGALLACAALWWQNQGLKTDLAEERAARAEEHAQRERERRAYEDAINQGVRKATDAYMARAAAARRDAAGLDAAYRGVLDTINAAGGTADDPAAACRADAERVRVLTRLLAEGAGLAAEGAQRVGRLDAQVTGLQDHAAAVAGPASPAGQVPMTP